MTLFQKKNKIEEKVCFTFNTSSDEKMANDNIISIKVLGSGCAKCNQLEVATSSALKQLKMDIKIEHVTDFAKIATYGVISAPALVINELVVSYGKVLKVIEVVNIIKSIKQ